MTLLDGDLRQRQAALMARPRLARDGRPADGESWGLGRIVRVRSRGPGVAVPVRNPIARLPTRLEAFGAGDTADAPRGRQSARQLVLVPREAAAGTVFLIVVE